MQAIKQETETLIRTCRLFSKENMFQDYKVCPNYRQNKIPFKKGVCPKCCNQVGDIQYVRNTKEYVKSNYGGIKINGISEMSHGFDFGDL